MPETLIIACPKCEKQLKAPAEVIGKKIRCKGCSEIFVAAAAPVPAAGKPEAKPAAPPPGKAGDDDDLGDGKPYGINIEQLGARCPECANAMEEGSIICLKCGYNTRSRSRAQIKRVRDITGFDVFLWLLPGILSLITVIGLIVWEVLYLLKGSEWFATEEWYGFLASGFMKLYWTIFTLFLLWFLGKIVVKRLILQRRPPEVEIKR